MKIIGIAGSLRDGSVTRQMINRVLQNCQQKGVQTELVDLRDYPLPLCDGRPNNDDSYGPVVTKLRQKLGEGDAFIIGTPEYHGGYSGVLKNCLDLTSIGVFKNKLVGLVGAAGGRLGADGALNQLRVVFKNLEAVCFPWQVSASGADVDKQGTITNAKVLERLDEMGKEFTQLARRLKPRTRKKAS